MRRFTFILFFILFFCSVSFSQENNDVQKFERHYFDDYSHLSFADESARIDTFLISFNDYPEAKALIVLYLDKNATSQNTLSRLKKIFNHIKRRKFEHYRVLFAVIKNNQKERTILWQIFPDEKLSEFTGQNSTMINAEEFEEKIKNLFPKK